MLLPALIFEGCKLCDANRLASLRRYVSRDRNIVQFYGACVQTNSLLLIVELMEVCVSFHLRVISKTTALAFGRPESSHICGCCSACIEAAAGIAAHMPLASPLQ